MDPLSKEQLSTLAHDLNSQWGIIHWASHSLNQTGLSVADYALFDDMLSRNTSSLQAILSQLVGHLLSDARLATLVGLLSKLEGQKSLQILAQLDPLLVEVKQLLNLALNQ